MKTIQLLAISLLAALISSCAYPVYDQPVSGGYGQQQDYRRPMAQQNYGRQQGQGERRIVGYKKVQTGTGKREIAYFEARLWNSEDEGMKKQASNWAARYFEKHHKVPSNEEVSEGVGFKCQVQRVR